MNRKKFSTYKALTVLLITIIIFSLGILIGNKTTQNKFNQVTELSENLQLQTMSIEVEFDILKENICLDDDVLFLTQELFDLAKRLDFMENTMGPNNNKIKELKEQYFILEAKHWLLAKERVGTCFNNDISLNNTIVLYFYSNKGDCPKCQQEGSVISYLHELYKGMKVYSFDIESKTPAVKVIKRLYGLNDAKLPALVINDKVHQDFLDANSFKQFIENQINNNNNETIINLNESSCVKNNQSK